MVKLGSSKNSSSVSEEDDDDDEEEDTLSSDSEEVPLLASLSMMDSPIRPFRSSKECYMGRIGDDSASECSYSFSSSEVSLDEEERDDSETEVSESRNYEV